MGFFDFLFGRSKGNPAARFVGEGAFRENLAKQTKMSPMTLLQLRKLGVTDSKSLKLEFFFYTDTQAKAQALTTILQGLGYDAHSEKVAGDRRVFLVNGWSTPVTMDINTVVSWTKKMCHLGFDHDADFDGWGTSPE